MIVIIMIFFYSMSQLVNISKYIAKLKAKKE